MYSVETKIYSDKCILFNQLWLSRCPQAHVWNSNMKIYIQDSSWFNLSGLLAVWENISVSLNIVQGPRGRQIEVWALCRPVKFFQTKLEKVFTVDIMDL